MDSKHLRRGSIVTVTQIRGGVRWPSEVPYQVMEMHIKDCVVVQSTEPLATVDTTGMIFTVSYADMEPIPLNRQVLRDCGYNVGAHKFSDGSVIEECFFGPKHFITHAPELQCYLATYMPYSTSFNTMPPELVHLHQLQNFVLVNFGHDIFYKPGRYK